MIVLTFFSQDASSPPVVGEKDLKSYFAPYGVYPGFGQYPGFIPIGYPYVTPAPAATAATVATTTARPLQPGGVTAYPLGAGVGYQRPGFYYPYPVATAAPAATTTTARPLQPGVVTAYPLGAGVGYQRPGFYYPYPGQFQAGRK